MRVDVSPEAEDFVRRHGGKLWVWAAHPRGCCSGTPAYMHAATTPAGDISGFVQLRAASLDIWFRAQSGQQPEVLEIGMHGKRRPRVEAYWDGCMFAL